MLTSSFTQELVPANNYNASRKVLMKRLTPKMRLLSLLLVFAMLLSAVPVYAAEEDTHDTSAAYTITLADDDRNLNGTIKVKIACPAHEEGHDYSGDDAIVEPTYDEETGKYTYTVHAGDMIVMRRQANSGYTVAEFGYVRTGREDTTYAMKSASQDTTLKDTFGAGYIFCFTMPEYDVTLGAYFAHKTDDTYINNALSPDKNVIAGQGKFDSPTEYIGLIMNDAWVYQSGDCVGVDAYVDSRLVDAFRSDERYTMHLEARAVNDEAAGYRVIAKLEMTLDAWIELCEGSETKTDDKGRTLYILDDLLIPMLDETALVLSDEIYCTLQIGHEDWKNTFGAPAYRWAYSGGDYAYVLPDDADMPEPMIWVHNLHPDTYFGEKVLQAVSMINEEWDMDITVHYVTPEVMDEPIGALAGWPGYALSNNGGSDVEISGRYLIYCNMPSVVREALGDYISRACRGEVTTAKLTKNGAAETFEHMYGQLDEESELFSAAYRLSLASYNASKDVTRENAGENHHWTEEDWEAFDALLALSAVLIAAPEGEYEAIEYRELATRIMEMHMDFNGDTLINYDFRFNVEEYDDEHYMVTVYASDVDMAELNIDYYWSYFDQPTLSYQIVKKDELYRVMCTISSTITKPGNFQTLYMSNPEAPEYTINATEDSIELTFAAYDYARDDMTHSYTLYNIPEVEFFTATLLDADGNVVSQQALEEAGTITFTGLNPGSEYKLRIYTANEVGRSDILTELVQTASNYDVPVFTDVAAGAYYHDAVLWAAENGIARGTTATTFSPEGICNRAQIVTFLWRAAGSPSPENTDMPFVDVAEGSFYYDAVLWAVENQITNGTSQTTFSPGMTVSRAQAVTMLWRWAGSPQAEQTGSFEDVAQGSYYEAAAAWAVAEGITTGTTSTTFSPEAPCLRGQTVTFLYRYMAE